MFKFEKLEVWKQAIVLSKEVHQLAKTFPTNETYVLGAQIKRAADSVALNIAEGSHGQTNAEQKLFLGYAIRSNLEVVACLFLGKERDLVKQEAFDDLYKKCESLIRMLQAFRNRL